MSTFENIEEYINSLTSTQVSNAIAPVLLQLMHIKEILKERNIPYKHWPQHMSLKQAMEYSGKTRSCIDKWVTEGLINPPYLIGGSTSKYYSKTELDTIKVRWQAIINKREKGRLKSV